MKEKFNEQLERERLKIYEECFGNAHLDYLNRQIGIPTPQKSFEPKIDLNLFKKKSNANTFKGFLLGRMNIARDEDNNEMIKVIQIIYKKYSEYEKDEEVILRSWKGKSSFELIEGIEKYVVVTYQKSSKGEKPKRMTREVMKIEVSEVLKNIIYLSEFYDEGIPTSIIAQIYYVMPWKDVFSDRKKHAQLNCILRILEKKEIITYKGGLTKLY